MRFIVALAIAFLAFSGTTFAAKRKAMLTLDYAHRPVWFYALDYYSECVIADNDSTSRIKTHVQCALQGRPSPKSDRFSFVVDSAAVESGFYPPEQQKSIAAKLTGGAFSIALIGGCPVVDTLSTFSVSEISEWDLVIQFAKLLPDVPRQDVRRGYSWDASGVFPVMTSMGSVPCEVYRLYKIDSLSNNGSLAHISWQFRYVRLADQRIDIPKRVPISGNGTGTAIIDAANHSLLEANVEFHTPVASQGNVQITWVEKTSLKYCR